jgi:pSer/pThr/pTyr-binding forkhead associated (FHA) protein
MLNLFELLYMNSTTKIVGRSDNCDYIILDPQNRVSRRHLEVKTVGDDVFIVDLKSLNGTYINGKRIAPLIRHKIRLSDRVTLSLDYHLDIQAVISFNGPMRRYKQNQETSELSCVKDNKIIVFDPDRSSIAQIAALDKSGFKIIGREGDVHIVINKRTISSRHCRVRIITPELIEVEDLGSTNGTFADGVRLKANSPGMFATYTKIRLGPDVHLNLEKILPGIKMVSRPLVHQSSKGAFSPHNSRVASPDEAKEFESLEPIWREYQNRQLEIANASINANAQSMGVQAAAGFIGPIGAILGLGAGVLIRYLATRKVNNLRADVSYEDMFLLSYACPRCKESFQKKPWITIRDCAKCKVKFRE